MWKVWWDTYGGRACGVAFGLLFGIIYLISGFWDMLFFALLVGVGYGFGKQRDEHQAPLIPWARLADWLTDRWRWPR